MFYSTLILNMGDHSTSQRMQIIALKQTKKKQEKKNSGGAPAAARNIEEGDVFYLRHTASAN